MLNNCKKPIFCNVSSSEYRYIKGIMIQACKKTITEKPNTTCQNFFEINF